MSDIALLQAINSLWILDPATLLELKKTAEKANEQQTAELQKLVKDVEKKQSDFVAKMIEADPQFSAKLTEFLHQSLQGIKGEAVASDAAALSNIDSQISAS